ncbi:MAG: hypothetical protein QM784_28940 [Polyangiaceae bacterium]
MTSTSQTIKGDNYQIEPTFQGTKLKVALKGTFDMTATPQLSVFLVGVESDSRQLDLREIVLDVSEVYYLGSSCIKSFVSLVESLKKLSFPPQLRVLISPRLDWHERTFSILARLSPALVTIEKAK